MFCAWLEEVDDLETAMGENGKEEEEVALGTEPLLIKAFVDDSSVDEKISADGTGGNTASFSSLADLSDKVFLFLFFSITFSAVVVEVLATATAADIVVGADDDDS